MRPLPHVVRTERLTMRLPEDADVPAELEMIMNSLDHLWPWFGFRAKPPTLEERLALERRQRAVAAKGTGMTYLLFAGDRALGKIWIDAVPTDPTTAEMGWLLRASATGQGYAVEAVRALADLAFDAGVERIEAHTDPDNTRSRALAERAGFTLEEIRPDDEDRPDGVRRPNCIYVLLKPGSPTGST